MMEDVGEKAINARLGRNTGRGKRNPPSTIAVPGGVGS